MALTALLLWPLIGLAIFAAIGPARGLIWTTMVGYLFLPEAIEFDLPALPPFDKTSSISLSLVLGILLFRNRLPKPNAHTADPVFRYAMLTLFCTLFALTLPIVATNGEALVNGPLFRPALGIRDAISMSIDTVILFCPLFLAWKYLNGQEHAKELCVALVGLGLFYTLLVLFEVRMSPQLHTWIYGYFQHSWMQHLRGGNFRPIVFLQHGLWVGFLLLSLVITAFSLSREHGIGRLRVIYLGAGVWTIGVILLSSNLGATLLVFLFCPAIFLMPRALLIRGAAIIAIGFLCYPALKHYSAAPTERVLALAERISEERAASFATRIRDEKVQLDRAFEKPLFGWGGWARGQVFSAEGGRLAVTDGRWIIVMGERGWIGYLTFFGLLALPILRLGHTARRKEIPWPVMGITLVCAANFIEMIPNAALTPIGFLFFGSLAAFVQYDAATQSAAVEAAPERREHRYSRFDASPTSAVAQPDNVDRPTKTKQRPEALPYRR